MEVKYFTGNFTTHATNYNCTYFLSSLIKYLLLIMLSMIHFLTLIINSRLADLQLKDLKLHRKQNSLWFALDFP